MPLPLGEVAERSEDGEGRHVKKICQWHIFSVDLSGYAAVASILVCTAPSFSLRSRRLYPVAVPKISLRHLSRRNFDRCHSFAVLYLPPAAHSSLPAAASILVCTAPSWIPSQSPTVTALPRGEPRAARCGHRALRNYPNTSFVSPSLRLRRHTSTFHFYRVPLLCKRKKPATQAFFFCFFIS